MNSEGLIFLPVLLIFLALSSLRNFLKKSLCQCGLLVTLITAPLPFSAPLWCGKPSPAVLVPKASHPSPHLSSVRSLTTLSRLPFLPSCVIIWNLTYFPACRTCPLPCPQPVSSSCVSHAFLLPSPSSVLEAFSPLPISSSPAAHLFFVPVTCPCLIFP